MTSTGTLWVSRRSKETRRKSETPEMTNKCRDRLPCPLLRVLSTIFQNHLYSEDLRDAKIKIGGPRAPPSPGLCSGAVASVPTTRGTVPRRDGEGSSDAPTSRRVFDPLLDPGSRRRTGQYRREVSGPGRTPHTCGGGWDGGSPMGKGTPENTWSHHNPWTEV